MISPGVVSFVGLGPGDRGLYTVRASERIAAADVVFGEEARVEPAELAALARAGKRVVRAWTGEGLDSEHAVAELRAVAAEGVACEVIPGVGASGAAAAFAGALGPVVRVAVDQVARTVAGDDREAQVTLIAHVGTPSQRVLVTSVQWAAAQARALGVAEVLLAYGAPEPALRWFERRPLFGKRVLVTRARDQAPATAALLGEHGAEAILVPTIALEPPADRGPLERAIEALRAGHYQWVAFTSANGVERTWEALVEAGSDARAFGRVRLAAIGPSTARALEPLGLRADVVAREFRGEGLAEAMLAALGKEAAGVRVLLPRAAKARDILPERLGGAGCLVDVVAAYETHVPAPESVEGLAKLLESGGLDAVLFTSSSTVENLCDLLGERSQALLAPLRVASIGPVTTESARARGVRVDVSAGESTVAGLVRALAESWA